ncbi:hypothetical protein VTJ83DRAFT_2526 [Remersonia thermophila]|uniref:Uncharacterized protein n=1 Tax=Remersonia thermophila TaxID=72144 RepID=A0ABR4DJ63_9PEZI
MDGLSPPGVISLPWSEAGWVASACACFSDGPVGLSSERRARESWKNTRGSFFPFHPAQTQHQTEPQFAYLCASAVRNRQPVRSTLLPSSHLRAVAGLKKTNIFFSLSSHMLRNTGVSCASPLCCAGGRVIRFPRGAGGEEHHKYTV